MSDFPYTDEQVREFAKTVFDRVAVADDGDLSFGSRYLARLHRAGFEVKFPELRFFAVETSWGPWQVWDRDLDSRAATFYGDAGEQHAREHADRLNREVSP